jgi:hypothetical protein
VTLCSKEANCFPTGSSTSATMATALCNKSAQISVAKQARASRPSRAAVVVRAEANVVSSGDGDSSLCECRRWFSLS